MRPTGSASRRLAPLLLFLAVAGCKTAAPVLDLPEDWRSLVLPPPAFAALYRLDCCGMSGMTATVRADGNRMLIAVAAAPGGVVAEVWVTASEVLLTRSRGRCVEAIPRGRLPLNDSGAIPLDVGLVSLLLSGRVPVNSEALASSPGWVTGEVRDYGPVRWRISGFPPRLVEIAAGEEGVADVRARLTEHHGRVPGRIEISSGSERAFLELREWQPGPAPEPPAWVGAPRCGAEP
ncbi:MAG: hypothetical protein ACOY3Y_17755 [Acidobacteriota bacterium]